MIFTRTEGQGSEPLVLVHGWGFDHTVFDPWLPALTDRWRVTRVDLPGHGRSPASGAAGGLTEWAAAIRQAIPEDALWAGWSLGGLPLLQAVIDGAMPRALLLLAASPCFCQRPDWPHGVPAADLDAMVHGLDAAPEATVHRFRTLLGRGGVADRRALKPWRRRPCASPEALRAGLVLLRDTDLRAGLAGVDRPACWLAGDGDPLIPRAAAARGARAMPRGEIAYHPRAGHLPFLTHPEWATDALQALSRQSRS